MTKAEAMAKAKALVAKMTVEEKMTQLLYNSPAIERLGINAYNWWNEGAHGVARAGTATVFPHTIAMAATFDPELINTIADVVSTEARAKYNKHVEFGDFDIFKGLTFWAPNINIFRDPRWGRGHETYGEDPYLTGRLGKAFINGLQGHGETMKAAACAKHFAVHSGPEANRHSFDAIATPKDMEETYLRAFEECVREAKVESVMGAYNRVNGEPSCGSKTLLVDILRGKWGFEGHVVSDCGAISDFHTGHFVTNTPAESAALGVKMGCDLNCGGIYAHLMSAYEQGLVSEADITTAAEHLFTSRYMLGIMGEGSEYDAIPYEKVECQEHLDLAKTAAHKSCVLLKNDGLLPLDLDKVSTVGVIGPNADNRESLLGNYYGTASRNITALTGIQNAMAGHGRVLYAEGCQLWREHSDHNGPGEQMAEAIIVAKHSDVVVLVLGLDWTLEGEQGDANNFSASGDKFDLQLPPVQRELMEKILEVGKPTVVLLMAGSAVDVSLAQEKANAVMLTWYPGAGGGDAVADLLFGKVSPSGKLPLTFYHNEALAEMPDFTDYSMVNRTYRYYTGTPLYPFGYGLTYSDVEVTGLSAVKTAATVTVENKGSRATEEVVQLYIKDNASSDTPTNPILCGFKRVRLEAGEAKTLEVAIDPRALTAVNDAGERIPGSGSWTLYAGLGQPDKRTEELTGKTALSVQI